MKCPKCGQKGHGNFCTNCGASLEDTIQEKWYLKTWFICLMFMLWPLYGIPLIIGLALLNMQNKERKLLADKYGSVDAIDKYIIFKQNEAENIIKAAKEKADKETNEHKEKLKVIEQEIKHLKEQKKELLNELETLNSDIIISSVDVKAYEELNSEEIKDKLAILRLKQQEMIKNNSALVITSSDSKKVLNNNIKQLIRCFNTECINIISNVSPKNVDAARGKIQKSFEVLNNIFSTDGVAISYDFLESKFEELNLVYAYELKREQEREQQRAIREQMLEEEKVRKEIEREKAKIEKEETQFRNEVNKLMKYLQKSSTDVEKELYIEKIKELEEKLSLLEKDKENILQREQNTRAGFVYIISNIGSFGENVYKIGMTRRLEPMDRIKELSDASVPFPFDVHALIFSEDAPALENILHQTFKTHEINKVNPRKEFFKVSLDNIERVVKENHNATVHFIYTPEAFEYWESLRLSKEAVN